MTVPTATSPKELRCVLAQAPTSLVAVSAIVDGTPTGMVVASFVGISLDPPLVAVSIQNTSSTWPRLKTANEIGLSVLTEDHARFVRQLSGPADQRFRSINWYSKADAVFLDQASAHFSTRLVEEINIGDHILAVLEVLDASHFAQSRPLVFHNSLIKTTPELD